MRRLDQSGLGKEEVVGDCDIVILKLFKIKMLSQMAKLHTKK